MRKLTKFILLLALLVLVIAYFVQQFPTAQKGTDFPCFYAAGRMVIDGNGGKLYDLSAQDRYLARYSGRSGIYFIHLPFETLFYLPFCGFSLRAAYAMWCLLNAGLLIVTAALFKRAGVWGADYVILVPIVLLFVPLLLNFYQGQDALLLLLFLLMAFLGHQRKQHFAAGCFLGLGIFKFHLALPIAIPFLVAERKKFLTGFTAVTIALLLISTAISGWSWFLEYPSLLAGFTKVPWAGVHSAQMTNLHGLTQALLPHHPRGALLILLLGSIAILWEMVHSTMLALASNVDMRLPFANSVVGSLLVGYHLSPHDLTILLLPFAFLTHHLSTRADVPVPMKALLYGSIGLLFLPPLHVLLLQARVYTYAGAVLLLLFCLGAIENRRISGPLVREASAK